MLFVDRCCHGGVVQPPRLGGDLNIVTALDVAVMMMVLDKFAARLLPCCLVFK